VDQEIRGQRSLGHRPLLAHVAPFAAWLILMTGLGLFGDPAPWKYAVRAAIGGVLLLALRPWRYYPRPNAGSLPLALAVGAGLAILWVGPEHRWGAAVPAWQELYLRFAVLPFGRLPDATAGRIYAPDGAGWLMAIVRLAGSAFVIAVIEEFFWRGFLYRRLQQSDFLRVDPGRFAATAFWITALFFGLEHHRWLVGILAGLGYGWLYVRTRDVWAVAAAHMLTNLLLGLYVLATRSYGFW